jgi:RNA polymerase sigma factor (sigma-70 family)
MPLTALSAVVATAARSASSIPSVSDGELLRRFIRSREEPAFAALVHRLGPMVLGVCRRVSRDRHLAEDAFQAAFVVLARRAAEVRPAEAVRAWLYGVAVRIARGVRAVSARRLARETPVAAVPDRAGERLDPPDADALAILDEEVAGLPDHLRVAVVLCELDGAGRKDAAARLAIAEGTLSSRLAKARKLLAERLRKRGVSLPAAGLAVLASSANVSARLAAKTSAFASAGVPLPPAVAALSNGVFRTMFLNKLTLGLACVAIVAVAGIIVASAAPDAVAQEPPKPRVVLTLEPAAVDEPQPPPAAKPAGPGAIVVGRRGPHWVYSPDGKKIADLDPPEKTRPVGGAAISPDGKRVAFVANPDEGLRPPLAVAVAAERPYKVVVRKLEKADGAKEWDLPARHLSLNWTADGKKLIASKINNSQWTEYEELLLDPETGKTEKLDIPANARVLDCARDGKTFLVQTYDDKAKKCELAIATLGAKDVTALCDLRDRAFRPTYARLSPDGKTVLFIDADPERKDANRWGVSQRVYVIGVAEKKREPLADFPENGRAGGVAWSPDGKKIAYTFTLLDEEVLKKESIGEEARKETEGFLVVADPDGKNAKTIASDKEMFVLAIVLGAIDWR